MSCTYIKLHTIAGRGAWADAVTDATLVCRRLGVSVVVEIDGMTVMINPGDDPARILEQMNEARRLGVDFAAANMPGRT